jgi:hypothetical protein
MSVDKDAPYQRWLVPMMLVGAVVFSISIAALFGYGLFDL